MSGYEDLRNSADWQTQLYSRYHHKVFGICLYFLKDREEAKDASHDVFIKAFRSWKDFEWKCDPLTWIGAIAKHDCFSRRLRVKKQMDRRSQLAVEEETFSNCEPEEDLLLHRMRLQRVMPGVRGKLREILRLSLEQGLNHREIAIRMGVSRVAITRRLTRFRKELQGAAPGRDQAFARTTLPAARLRRERIQPAFPKPARRERVPAQQALEARALENGELELSGVESDRQLIAA
jgi:RNA polymerase sigma-70 factor (ECF subfamily)